MNHTIYPAPAVRRSVVRDILAFHNRPDMIPFAGGLPDPDTLPVAEIARAAQYVLSRQGAVALQYGTTEGYRPLREFVAEYLCKRGFATVPDEIIITSGSQQGMDLISRWLLKPGDPVYAVEPMYNGALQNFESHGACIVPLATDREGPIVHPLIQAFSAGKTHAPGGFLSLSRSSRFSVGKGPGLLYLQPTLDNPTGGVISTSRRMRIARALGHFRGWMLEEDPYGELLFDGHSESYISSLQPDRSLLLGSFSKIVSPSLRIGWIRGPSKAIDSLVPIKQSMDLHTNLFSQMVLHRFLQDTNLDSHLERIRDIYRNRQTKAIGALLRYGIIQDLPNPPAGGMFLWIETEMDSDELARRAMSQGVALVPGSAFFSHPADGKRFFRLNYTAVDRDAIETGIERLARALSLARLPDVAKNGGVL